MKKISIAVFLIVAIGIAGLYPVFADQANKETNAPKPLEVITSEDIPGAGCVQIMTGGVEKNKYKCTVKSGFASVRDFLGTLIKYATFITALLGVLMIVFSGIQWSLSADDEGARTKAKGRISKLIMGLVLLFLVGFILNTVAPWVYR